jgi:hypothetical protein
MKGIMEQNLGDGAGNAECGVRSAELGRSTREKVEVIYDEDATGIMG